MNLYRIRLRLRGPYATPWLADTLYGHLCWAALRLGGQRDLDDLLLPAMEGEPVLVLSDGFPGDLLPAPVLPPAPTDPSLTLNAQRDAFEAARQRRRAVWSTPAEFSRLLQGERLLPAEPNQKDLPQHRGMLKNQVNRLTGATPTAEEGGGLYEFQETFQEHITVYALVAPDFKSTVDELLAYLAASGFGKRKAVGYGALAETPSLDPFEGFGSPSQANGFVALSTFVPARNDPTQGQWNLLVKYGKLGEELAFSENPFKFPLLMVRAGSTFYHPPAREFYGRLVEGISPLYKSVHQPAFCLPVPMLLPSTLTPIDGGAPNGKVGSPGG